MNTHHDIHILYCNQYFKLLTICVIIPIYMTYCIYIKYIFNVKVTSSPDQIYPFTARWPGGWRMEAMWPTEDTRHRTMLVAA